MKKLQNNFTTPAQSKRLLELGVPVWTADGQYNEFNGEILVLPVWSQFSPIYENNTRKPCWSVGRLIEIISICIGGHGFFEYFSNENMIEHIIELMNNLKLDFSIL